MRNNTSYHNNSRHNLEKIKKIVEKLMDEDLNPSPFDFLFRYNTRNYPKISHKLLDLPGNFQNVEDTAVFIPGDGVLQMDYAESVTPNGDMVKREAANDVEHQKTKLTICKINAIFNYCFYKSIELKKPCYPIVVTNHDYGTDHKTYCIEGISFTIYFRIFDENRVQEILNTLSSKDYNQVEFSNEDFINFIHCIIFAKKPYVKKIIEKSAYLFASIENISYSKQLDLHLALKMMIKYHFNGDNNKIEELLTVITKAVNESVSDEISGYEVKQKTNDELRKEISQLKAKDEQSKMKISEMGSEISKRDSEISKMGSELSKKDSELSEYKKRVENLEKVLSENNILI